MNTEKSASTMTPLASSNGRKAVRKAKKFSDSSSSPSRRKSLQLLQPVAGAQSQLVGSDGVIRLTKQTSKTPKRKLASDGKSQPKKVFRSDGGKNFTIFEDTSNSSSSSSSPTPSAEQEVLDMMTGPEPTGKYWEELAEERRVALEETLKENEKLFIENSELKEENDKLKVMADQAEYLADVVETLMNKMESSPQKTLESRDNVGTSGYDDNTETDHDQGSDDEEEKDIDEEDEDEVFVHKEDIEDDAKEVGESIATEGEEDEV
ncbi:geminin [Strongylocentrotus purpuratus]|uniref:Geminin n=1 Tax=Strongylocentrotus purpuratus TaxID=7668 RepID=A0A7M7HQF4_STRPU|nr:geminin [Strongylocentrotus purpuratus]XP_011682551.1 geminin [Strongylocentrotus purpuratus]|eukprot:XP_011682550.1 PREDICTED: geminin [Strongylocentrotus purpuratus]